PRPPSPPPFPSTTLFRSHEQDIRRAAEALADAEAARIHTFLATSPIHMEKKLKMTPEQVLEQAVRAVRLARSLCDDVEFSPEDRSEEHTSELQSRENLVC